MRHLCIILQNQLFSVDQCTNGPLSSRACSSCLSSPPSLVRQTTRPSAATAWGGDPDGVVDGDDPWFWFCYDESWRIVAVFRDEDDHPKEVYVHHNAGLDGYGVSSYIDAVVLRDRDANTAWAAEADGTLEERVHYCQNWRADVVALFGSNGHMLQQVRYDPYGVPFGISKADLTADGVLDSNDSSLFVTLYNSGSGTHPFADWNLDGTLSSLDLIAYGNSYTGDVALGYGVLAYGYSRAGGANRKAYAGYEIDPVLTGANGRESVYHVRHRVLLSELGRWNRRDPLGYVDGMSVYEYAGARPIVQQDHLGLATKDLRVLPARFIHCPVGPCGPDCVEASDSYNECLECCLVSSDSGCAGDCKHVFGPPDFWDVFPPPSRRPVPEDPIDWDVPPEPNPIDKIIDLFCYKMKLSDNCTLTICPLKIQLDCDF